MALVWAFSGDLTGTKAPLESSGWTFWESNPGHSASSCDVLATSRQPLVGYGGSEYAFRIRCDMGVNCYITTPSTLFTPLADGIVGFHIWRNNYGTSSSGFYIQSGGVDVVKLQVDTSGVISVYVHDTSSLVLEFTCTPTWTDSTAIYIGIRYKPGASGEIGVAINGGTADTASGSYHTGAWDAFKLYIYGRSWVNHSKYLWMPTVWSSAADPALTIPQWVAKITPDADALAGSFTASTGSDLFAMVDEAVYSASDYIETTTTPDDTMRFTGTAEDSVHADWAPAAIAGVVGYAAVRGDGALNSAQIAWSSGGTAALGSATATSTSVVTVTDVLALDPDTSAAFLNVAAIDALQFGIKAS